MEDTVCVSGTEMCHVGREGCFYIQHSSHHLQPHQQPFHTQGSRQSLNSKKNCDPPSAIEWWFSCHISITNYEWTRMSLIAFVKRFLCCKKCNLFTGSVWWVGVINLHDRINVGPSPQTSELSYTSTESFCSLQNWLDWWLSSELRRWGRLTQVRAVQVPELQPHRCLLWHYYLGSDTSVIATLANQSSELSEGDLLLLDCNPAYWWRKKERVSESLASTVSVSIHLHLCNLSPCGMGVIGREGILYSFELHMGNLSAPSNHSILLWVKLLFKAKSRKKKSVDQQIKNFMSITQLLWCLLVWIYWTPQYWDRHDIQLHRL